MAGPSLSGPLSGWTSSTLAPKAPMAPTAGWAAAPGSWDSRTPEQRKMDYENRKKIADTAEKEARASGDPAKLQRAFELSSAAFASRERVPGESQTEAFLTHAQSFRSRNPTVKLSPQVSQALGPLPSKGAQPAATEQRPPDGPSRNPVDIELARIAGESAGFDRARVAKELEGGPVRGGAIVDYVSDEARAADMANGGGMAKRLEDAFLAGSASSPIDPARARAAFGLNNVSPASGNLSAYNLTDEELGAGLGPDPRAVVKPQTPLESLLSAIYPDAATSGGSTVGGDPRGQSQQPSVINNILANLGAPSQTSGYVPAPALASAGAGAQIASTIPGAPPFLAGAINNVSGYGGGFVPAPAAARPTFDPLIGISAISAEQRIQAAQLAKEKADRQAAYFAQLRQRQREQQQADQIARQRVGGLVSQSGWNSPSFSPGGWTPSFPTY